MSTDDRELARTAHVLNDAEPPGCPGCAFCSPAPGEVVLDRTLADRLAAEVARIEAEAADASDADENGEPRRFVAVTQDRIRPLDEADRADLRQPEPPGCSGCRFCAPGTTFGALARADQEAASEPLPLVEDGDGAPYPAHVQDALRAVRDALTTVRGAARAFALHLPLTGAHPAPLTEDQADDLLPYVAPVLLDLLPNPEAEPTTDYALALMRSTLLTTQHPDETADGERGLFTHAEAVAATDALRPQVTRMLADADARVERARAAAQETADAPETAGPAYAAGLPTDDAVEAVARSLASLERGEEWPSNAALGGSLTGTRDDEYRAAMTEQARDALDAAAPYVARMIADARAAERVTTEATCYAGAADEPGDLAATPTPGQWLRRLFDLPETQRLVTAQYLADAGARTRRCFEQDHTGRIERLEAELAHAAAQVAGVRRADDDARARWCGQCAQPLDEDGRHPAGSLCTLRARNAPTLADALDADGGETCASMAAEPNPEADALADALRLTVEYVGTDTLPALPGWSWFDALSRYRPEVAQRFTREPEPSLSVAGTFAAVRQVAERIAPGAPEPESIDLDAARAAHVCRTECAHP